MKLIITDIENFNIPIKGEYKIIQPKKKIPSLYWLFRVLDKNSGEMCHP